MAFRGRSSSHNNDHFEEVNTQQLPCVLLQPRRLRFLLLSDEQLAAVMSKYLKHFTSVGDNHNESQWKEDDEKQPVEEEPQKTPHPFISSYTFRDALKWLSSVATSSISLFLQILIVCLVILDALFVLIEVLLDLELLEEKVNKVVPEIFHYLSVSVLSFFLLEIAGKLYAFRLEFFHHKFEVFDAVIVIISFIIDVVYLTREDFFSAVGLLILLRLWRVARIVNGKYVIFIMQFLFSVQYFMWCTD
ncbi:unnamed protein product [Ranitomeya imitator]|uniref:Hydrogen voltage-gated channel 1 n=1 Tax=Ranitomeya imitator TaxID=111125 RepID=A0ABN9KXC8_9NEOB|nr:unnamed protein product [Ranitomeya imitator]